MSSKTNTASIIRAIKYREEVKSSFRMLQPIAKGVQGGVVSTIRVQVSPLQGEADYREIDDPDK
eukprot:439742-Ditylum_brightwellii.AAC.1